MKLAAIGLLALSSLALAQRSASDSRYEVMWRLRELDREWMDHEKSEEHAKALPLLEKAAASLSVSEVARAIAAIDAARDLFVRPPYIKPAWPDCLSVDTPRVLFDQEDASVALTFAQLYGADDINAWYVSLFNEGDHIASEALVFPREPPSTWAVDLRGSPGVGDHRLEVAIGDSDFVWSNRTVAVSIVEHRDARLVALDEAIAKLPEKARRVERLTLRMLGVLLYSLAHTSPGDRDYPAARLLAEAEKVAALASRGERYYGPAHTGQFWLALEIAKVPTNVRVMVPKRIESAKPTTLVVALPAAPYSENTFFDIYGAGQIATLCEERNWLLVSPRQTGAVDFGEIASLVDAIAEIYPVDRSHVFLVGHSQGAGFAVEAAKAAPTKFRGVAALAHGFAVKEVSALKDVPLFIGAGDHDEFRTNAKQVVDDLRAAGSKVATFKLYPNCERLMICADALPDVFEWFDELAK